MDVKALLEGVTRMLSGKVTGFVFGRLKIGSWQTRMFQRPDPVLCTVLGKRRWRRLKNGPQRWVSRGLGSQDCYSMACAAPQSSHVIFPRAMFPLRTDRMAHKDPMLSKARRIKGNSRW